MAKKRIERREIDFAPGENTFGLRVIREEYDNGSVYWKYGLPDVVQVMGITTSGEVIAIHEWQAGLGAFYTHLVGRSVEDGEEPEETARREFFEETGYEAQSLELLSVVLQDTGRSDRKQHFFLARSCTKAQEGEKEIKAKLFRPDAFWEYLTNYFLARPEVSHGGGNSLQAATLAFQKLGLLKLDLSSFVKEEIR